MQLPAGNWKWWVVGGVLLALWLQRRRQLVASGATPGEGGGGDALSNILKQIASIQAPELSALLPFVPRSGPSALEQILAAENPPAATTPGWVTPTAAPAQSAPVAQSYSAPLWVGGGGDNAGGGADTGGGGGGGGGGDTGGGGTTGSDSGGLY